MPHWPKCSILEQILLTKICLLNMFLFFRRVIFLYLFWSVRTVIWSTWSTRASRTIWALAIQVIHYILNPINPFNPSLIQLNVQRGSSWEVLGLKQCYVASNSGLSSLFLTLAAEQVELFSIYWHRTILDWLVLRFSLPPYSWGEKNICQGLGFNPSPIAPWAAALTTSPYFV